MEELIWSLLGYLAMPVIFATGFVTTAFFVNVFIDLLRLDPAESSDPV